MTQKIEEIAVPEAVAGDYSAAEPFNSLRGIRRLNVFVGPNNSGKSRLLRSLFTEGDKIMLSSNREDDFDCISAIRSIWKACASTELQSAPENLVRAYQGAVEINDLLLKERIGFFSPRRGQVVLSEHRRKLDKFDARQRSEVSYLKSAGIWGEEQAERNTVLLASVRNLVMSVSNFESRTPLFEAPLEFVYVPTLRGMRMPRGNDELADVYFDRTYADYFDRLDDVRDLDDARRRFSGTRIVTGLDLYKTLTEKLLGSLAEREFVRDFEHYLSRTFFESAPVALIPRIGDNTVHIKIGNETERPVHSLGDGLQQLIILTLPLFQHAEKPLLLFIEEPDLFLHPGYQRVLIDTILRNENENLYVFVTTHSTQFLDITIGDEDCAVFRCGKEVPPDDAVEHDPKFTVSNVGTGNLAVLESLGVRPSSLMLANCTIWVEGITDRLYIGRYIQLVAASRKEQWTENLHFAFVEYGGGNITHWSFLDDEEGMDVKRICSSLFLVSDRDAGKDERHAKLAASLGEEKYYCLGVREIENLLTPDVITSVIRDYECDSNFGVKSFKQGAYAKSRLGKYIDDKVLSDKTKSKRYKKLQTCYEGSSGTVKDKVTFCRKALRYINSLDDMSDEAKAIGGKLCDFVAKQNQ